MKKNGLGIALLVLAGLVLLQGYLPDMDISLWKLVWLVGLGYFLIKAILRKQLIFSFALGTWLFIALNNHFDWVDIDTWTLIVGAGLACAGLQLLFKPKKPQITSTGVIGDMRRETAFGSSTRYIHDDNFLHDSVEVAFGSSTVYFDQAVILGDKADFHIDAAFSSVTLYLPTNWQAVVELDSALSTTNNYAADPKEKILLVTGDLAFSNLTIYSA